ncbi:MAG: SOS response-associated peptidase [Phycisphaerales bacterium]|jgi:putative SOS response-associated peptidase YedK|nr:SOS response-associated peptidase [Phycisphaerales bacterium]
MCGRVVQFSPLQVIIELFGVIPTPGGLTVGPRYNLAPTQDILAIRQADDGTRQLLNLHWGLIPFWAKAPDMGGRMINARAETVAEKPAFREPFRRRRCLIPIDGFYEWQRLGTQKQPHYIHRRNDRPFGLAGLWERWSKGDQTIESCTILTTSPNDLMRPIHDRMPVILSQEDYAAWLAPESKASDLLKLLKPYEGDELAEYPVSTRVNIPKNDDPGCITPLSQG